MIPSPLFCNHCGCANNPQATICMFCQQDVQGTQVALRAVSLPTSVQVSQTATGLLSTNQSLRQRYTILSLLGSGGMGAVYLAEDTLLARQKVAIKEVSLSAAKDITEATEAFKREATMLANLSHPNLPRIRDYFDEQGRSYLAMDYIEGKTLEDSLNDARQANQMGLLADDIIHIGIVLCDVLDYLHTRQPPIVFRDLKPSNIMRAPDGTVYLIDFGIARHFTPGRGDTYAFGSYGYAAPEQFKKATSPLSDIYSLGATLHALSCGEEPSDPIAYFAPLQGVPAELDALIQRMVERNAVNRPASAGEVREVLEQILDPQPTLHIQSLPVAPPLPVVAVGATMCVYKGHGAVVSALAWSPDGSAVASASDDNTLHIWYAVDGQQLYSMTQHSPLVKMFAWSPDGHFIVDGIHDQGDEHVVQVWDRKNGHTVLSYLGHRNKIRAVAWSPNGKYVVSSSEDGTVQVWEAQTGKHIVTYLAHPESVMAVVWSPDSQYIASGSDDGMVHIWYATTGQLMTCYTGHRNAVRTLDWSSDGRMVVSGSWDRSLHIWEAHTGRQQMQFMQHARLVTAVAWQPGGMLIASASKEKEVLIWDASTGIVVWPYGDHQASVHTLAWSPDGRMVASGGADKTVRVWRAC